MSRRRGAYGTGGLVAAVILLMVLGPAAGAAAHPNVVVKAPYKGSLGSPSSYSSLNGCAKERSPSMLWNPNTGTLSGIVATVAKACKKTLAGFGSYSSAYATTSLSVLIPFKVPKNGNHSISDQLTLNLASTEAWTTGGCPAKNINYAIGLYQYSSGECYSAANLDLSVNAQVRDLSNTSWYSTNSSYLSAYNSSYWQNYSSCSNYGTLSCTNSTSGYSYGSMYGYNEVGGAGFSWTGSTALTLYTNATNMAKHDQYALYLGMYLDAGSSLDAYGLLSHWGGSASASINLLTLGNGAVLNSITIA